VKAEKELLLLIRDLNRIGLSRPIRYIRSSLNKSSIIGRQLFKILVDIERTFIDVSSPVASSRKKALLQLRTRGYDINEIPECFKRDREEEEGADGPLFTGKI